MRPLAQAVGFRAEAPLSAVEPVRLADLSFSVQIMFDRAWIILYKKNVPVRSANFRAGPNPQTSMETFNGYRSQYHFPLPQSPRLKSRGLTAASGDAYAVTATEQISGRLDTKLVRQFLGDAYPRFEIPVISTVVRIKPTIPPLATLAA